VPRPLDRDVEHDVADGDQLLPIHAHIVDERGVRWKNRAAMAERYPCPACGRENAADQRFCTNCGTELLRRCPTCSHTNPPGSRFCGNCGTTLPETPRRVAAPPAPPVAPASARGEERRLATVLFADIIGFTNLTRELADPEEAREVADRAHTHLAEIVAAYGGTVDKVIGDAIMAVFGPPVAHDDDPERAVRAALDMQEAAAADELAGLRLRVGIDTGEVMYAPVGPGSKREFTVIGDAVNTAARLQSSAPEGGVLVGRETRTATRGSIVFHEAGPVGVKAGEQPVAAWIAHGVRDAREERLAVPLVGREYELNLLATVWERVEREGRTQLVTLLGQPGIGKTRLAAEAAERARGRGARVLTGRSLPYGDTGGYGAFAQQIRQQAEIYASDPAPRAREKLERAVAALIPSASGDVARELAVLLGLADEEGGDRQALFFAARRFVEALAADGPTVLVFEDIHWADESLLDLLEHLASRLRGASVLLLTLTRLELLETRPTWGGGLSSYTALPLEPLSARESRELAARLLVEAGEAQVTQVAERLGATGEGNPLFIEELAASLVERATDTAGQLPTTVKGIIAARLDALPNDERSVLFDASVVGKVFWRGAVESLRPGDEALSRSLAALEDRDLIRREPSSRLEGDEEFTFKHMLIREVAYATLPRSVRRERHAVVAQFMEDAAGERATEAAAMLAHHWREAGERERAAHYLVAAAEQAARAWAKSEAASLYDEAIELIGDDHVGRRRELRLARALALNQAGDFGAAVPALDELLLELEGRRRFEALRARFHATFWGLADAEGARRFADHERVLAEELGDEELVALAFTDQAGATAMGGEVEVAVRLGRQGLAIWPRGRRPVELGEALEWQSLEHYWLGRYEEALPPGRRAYEVSVDAHSVIGVINGSADIGLALTGLGRHEEALTAFERGAAHGKELELQPRFTSRLTNMWAGTLRELYALDDARRLNEEAIEAGKRISFPGAIVSGQIDLLMIDLLLGDVGAAERALPALAEGVKETRGWHQWLWTGRLVHARAEIELAAGRHDSAVERAREALATAERYRRAKYVAASRRTLATALLAAGRPADAADEAARALAAAERLHHPPSMWQAAATLARARAVAGDDDGAEESSRVVRATIERFAAHLSEERRDRFLRTPQLEMILEVAH
jgi:class 3 adenylate cyclase/tetratricopeptide (TPR) repeat protein